MDNHSSGNHVYAVTDFSLLVFRRNANTGRLTRTAYDTSLTWRAETLAISSDGRNLFVFDDYGQRTRLFSLAGDPSNPREFGASEAFWNTPYGWRIWDNTCGARARMGTSALDGFSMDIAFGVQWQSGSDSLEATDFVAPWQPDHFNNPVPEFGHTRNFATRSDGRLGRYSSNIIVRE